jgi:predicted nucleic acid-binding protein
LDPNVLVSAAITPSGATAEMVRLIDAGLLVPIVSPLLLSELAQVLHRPRSDVTLMQTPQPSSSSNSNARQSWWLM